MRLHKKSSKKAGLPPGTLVHIGEERTEKARIDFIDYDENRVEEMADVTLEACLPFKALPTVTWVDVTGIHDTNIIEEIGKAFGIHPLILEDIVHSGQRPKMEDMGDYLYIVLKMLIHNSKEDGFEVEQVSLIVGSNFVISFQEKEGDVFQSIRQRIRKGKGRSRKSGSDYLAYTIIDAIVDNYFIILEDMGEKIEGLQEDVISRPDPSNLKVIQDTKRHLVYLRRSIWPLREAISSMQRSESPLIGESIGPYMGDVYDHTIQVIETIETLRDTVSGTLDIYLSSMSNKLNEVMKVLTMIATIFIPLTFIAGVYGMNFKHMPELEWKWSYPVLWIAMVLLGSLMLIGFRRKKWL
ncbi:MAG: magnesium/cobalt transporter CorA [Desulfobacteraceae bacterium]|nr:magnesium/cobalt transporter CorA [Desulfobacterales bacterium]MBL6967609.1 magnesium/cobalt transporter CorA [Desulfobacteraceae bacterium]MBL7101926.1 magnesium/cobalt transporter CorA [Desulfobacteraceae bacterium]MBL7171670.1 magnesium/cobalt transporter CorA [Desulfobacteraceae bacterium]